MGNAVEVRRDGLVYRLVYARKWGPGGRFFKMLDATPAGIVELAAQMYDGDEAGPLRAERDAAIAAAVMLEAQVAIARELLEADYRRRQVGEHAGCLCRECGLLRALFGEDGGRAFVEEHRELRIVADDAIKALGDMLGTGEFDEQSARETVLRCAKAIGAHVTFAT